MNRNLVEGNDWLNVANAVDALVVKFTGEQPEGGKRINDIRHICMGLYQIADAEIGSLPSVTAADNGDVLMVVDGAWAKASIPAADGVSF